MKRSMYLFSIGLLLSANSIINADVAADTASVEKLKPVAEKCLMKDDAKSCESLVTSLVNLCQSNNALACLELARVGVLGVQASIAQKNEQATLQWLDITLTSTKKSCDLGNQDACKAFAEIKTKFAQECKQGDQFSCEVTKVLK